MSTIITLNKLKQWKKPHKYRSVVAYGLKGIYEVDMMYLYLLWDKVFTSDQKTSYGINDYALFCVDVYSRYVKARSIGYKYKSSIARSLNNLLRIMGKPQIISADNEIINALYENSVLYKEFEGITLYRTSAHELNKNAVVERMIRTLKQYLINILMTYTIDQLHSEFLKFRTKIQVAHKMNITFVDYLLEFACEINNNKEHTTIHVFQKKSLMG